jgi:hypothetical protein
VVLSAPWRHERPRNWVNARGGVALLATWHHARALILIGFGGFDADARGIHAFLLRGRTVPHLFQAGVRGAAIGFGFSSARGQAGPDVCLGSTQGAASSGKGNMLMNTNMKYPKLGFRNASVDQQIVTAGRLARGAAKLPQPLRERIFHEGLVRTLGEAEAIREETARLRAQLAATMTQEKNVMARLRNDATRCARSLWAHSSGDAQTLLEAGLDLEKSRRVRTGPPGVPTRLRARELNGAITLLWRNPMRRSWFHIEVAEGQPHEENWRWNNEWSSTKGRFTFTGLKPNVVHWFRVKAFNTNGESPWSDFVSGRAR